MQAFGRYAVGADDAPAQHRHALELCAGCMLGDEAVEPRRLVRLEVEKIKRRRAVGQPSGELPAQIAVDQRDGDKQREP